MEIQKGKLESIKEKILRLWEFKPKSMYPGAYICFKQNVENTLSDEDNLNLVQSADLFNEYLTEDELYDVILEIRTNLTNIPTNEACLRYLNFILQDLKLILQDLEYAIDYEYWNDPEIVDKICSVKHLTEPKIRYKQFITDITERESILSKGAYSFTQEELETIATLKNDIANIGDSPVHYLLRTYFYKRDAFIGIIYCVEEFIEQLTPANEIGKIELYDLSADRHRLVLLSETGVFKMLVEKYLDPLNPKMRLEDFAKLISTMIGAKSKELRSDVGKLRSELTDPKMNKTVLNKNSLKEVSTFLASLGLPLNNNM